MRLVTAAILALPLFIAGNVGAQPNPPGRTEVAAAGGPIVITPFMHASVQIEHAGKVIQVDPSMGDVANAKAADLILVTDIHDDHMNPGRVAKLRKAGAPVVAPAAVRDAGTSIAAPIEVLANGCSSPAIPSACRKSKR